MRAERDRRAVILTAEGTKQSEILNAEGMRQAAILRAEGDAKAAVLRAEGEAKAITTVFGAIHEGNPDNLLLAYQYLQTLPKLAEGPANKLWIIPSELTEALKGIGTGVRQPSAATPLPRRSRRHRRRRLRHRCAARRHRRPLTRAVSAGVTFLAGPLPRVIAHRGLALDAPENTLLAFLARSERGRDAPRDRRARLAPTASP